MPQLVELLKGFWDSVVFFLNPENPIVEVHISTGTTRERFSQILSAEDAAELKQWLKTKKFTHQSESFDFKIYTAS